MEGIHLVITSALAIATVTPTGVCSLPGAGTLCHLPGAIASDAWGSVVNSFTSAVGKALTLMFTFWLKIPAPSLSSAGGSAVGELQSELWWVVGPVAVLGVLVGAGRMALSQRAQPGVDTVKSVALLSVVMGGGVAVVAGLVTAMDALAGGILSRASGGDFQARLADIGQINLADNATLGGPDSALVLLIALVALLGSLVMCATLVLRGALLVVMVASLPLAAAATNTEMGRAWFKKSTAWLVAFIVLKPAAALVYATAFYLIGDGTDAASEVGGMFLLAMACATLPALMRLLVPGVASVASGGGAGEAAAGLGAVASGATGFASMAGGSSGGGSSGRAASAGASAGGSGAGLAAKQTTSSLAAAAVSSGSAGGGSGSGGSSGGGGGSGGGIGAAVPAGASGGAGLAAPPGEGSTGAGGTTGAAGAAGSAGAAAAGGPAGMAAQAGLRAAGEIAKGAKAVGDAATGTGDGATGAGEEGTV